MHGGPIGPAMEAIFPTKQLKSICQKNQNYPSYFPYWLQVNGVAGKAKIRIIDSGSNLKSPKPPLSAYDKQA